MSIEACAELVRRSDPDRFLSAMTASPNSRGALFTLYAFNLEVARAPWVTAEPMIAEMRLQWWKDVVEEAFSDGDVRRHEVATPLGELIREKSLPREPFDALISARSWDIYKEPHEDEAAFQSYLSDTNGSLTHLSYLALGGQMDATNYGAAAGVARLFTAIPELQNAQKYPLVDGTFEGVKTLAEKALFALRDTKKKLSKSSKEAKAALRAEFLAEGILKRAAADPSLVIDGGLDMPEGRKKLRLMSLAFTGQF